MTRMALSLDSGVKGKPVYLAKTRRRFGHVDDVIIDPKFGVLAIVSQDSRSGTWAFPYTRTRISNDGITVIEEEKQSPRKFFREGRSYQDMLGAKVLGPDLATIGRVKDIELINIHTGDIAYRVAPPGLRGLWSPAFSVDGATEVGDYSFNAIILGAEPQAPVIADGAQVESRHMIQG
jgi:sporulation protein YlmC with PRC-barrel domain